MKISSRSPAGTLPIHGSHFAHEAVLPKLQHAARTVLAKLDQIGTAIALGEAGDLDGAHALREKNTKKP